MANQDDPKPGSPDQNKGSHRPVRCPNPRCRHILFDTWYPTWDEIAEGLICPDCKHQMVPWPVSIPEQNPKILSVEIVCLGCKKHSVKHVTGIRKYCHGCKLYQVMFLDYLPTVPNF